MLNLSSLRGRVRQQALPAFVLTIEEVVQQGSGNQKQVSF
jgi:hypothetical protein